MRILVLSMRWPHRRVLSGHVIVYERVRRLAQRGHEVGLAAFEAEGEPSHLDEWRPLLRDARAVRLPPRAPLLTRLGGVPPPFDAWWSDAMMRTVGEMVRRDRYDVAVAEFSPMGPYLCQNPYLPAVRTVLSCHQCATVACQKRCDLLGYSVRGLVERWRRDRLRTYEFDLYRRFDRVLVLTPQERYQLATFRPDLRVEIVPRGVDTDFFRRQPGGPAPDGLLYTGFYEHEPNRDAVLWFARAVWPALRGRHPALKFYVVGPGADAELRALGERDPRIVVTGEVEDVREYLRRALVFVCPVRIGSGMWGKILEAMAYEVPVVSTSLGAEGVPVQPGETCLLADDAGVMARQVEALLVDEPLRRSVASRAVRMVRERLSWDHSIDRIESVLLGILGRPARPAAGLA